MLEEWIITLLASSLNPVLQCHAGYQRGEFNDQETKPYKRNKANC